jgi:hypothetical protein
VLSLLEQFKNEKRWQNKCLLLELIHLSMLRENEKWTAKDTAKLTKQSVGAVSENLALAKAVHDNTMVSAAKSRNSALKLLKGDR